MEDVKLAEVGIWNSQFSVSLKLKSFLKNFSGSLHIRFHTYLPLHQHSGLQKHGCEIIAEKKQGLERSC